jgi:Amt family ammonium transporter
VLYKNLCDTIIGAIIFYFLGYGFAFGGDGNDFIGGEGFALNSVPECDYAMFFFQFTFAATAVTIVSGAVAERCTVSTYVTYSMYITGFVYPVVVYWVWSGNGWLWEGASDNDDVGYRDFAGSGVVHMTGGAAALAACYLMGPRKRRIGSDGKLLPTLAPHSTPLVTLGAFVLMFGFFAFNGGSQLALVDSTGENGAVIALAVVNTIMAAAGGGLACGVWSLITTKKLSLLLTVNGVIGGMVAICASANVVFPWAALIIGAVAGLVVVFWSWMMRKCGVDDAIDAIAVHLGCGWWGVMAEPLFNHPLGIFFRGSNPISWDKLGWNLAGSVIIFVWAFSASFVLFYILKVLGVLRVSAEIEEDGTFC